MNGSGVVFKRREWLKVINGRGQQAIGMPLLRAAATAATANGIGSSQPVHHHTHLLVVEKAVDIFRHELDLAVLIYDEQKAVERLEKKRAKYVRRNYRWL